MASDWNVDVIRRNHRKIYLNALTFSLPLALDLEFGRGIFSISAPCWLDGPYQLCAQPIMIINHVAYSSQHPHRRSIAGSHQTATQPHREFGSLLINKLLSIFFATVVVGRVAFVTVDHAIGHSCRLGKRVARFIRRKCLI